MSDRNRPGKATRVLSQLADAIIEGRDADARRIAAEVKSFGKPKPGNQK